MTIVRQDSWTEQEGAFLREKWALGVSAANIGKMLGRSAAEVAGKIDRMGLNQEVRQTPSLRKF